MLPKKVSEHKKLYSVVGTALREGAAAPDSHGLLGGVVEASEGESRQRKTDLEVNNGNLILDLTEMRV